MGNYLTDPYWLVAFLGSLFICQALLCYRARRRAHMLSVPLYDIDKPDGVAIEREDGTRLNVELVYAGQDDDGMHHWWVAGAVLLPGDTLCIARLPPHHCIDGAMEPPA